MPGNTPAPQPVCEATLLGDAGPCEGPRDAVTVLDRHGTSTKACVPHGIRLHASLTDAHVLPGSVPCADTEVRERSRTTSAFAWLDHHQLPDWDKR
ncbi:hypothetical protein ACFVVU_21800 [Kitasatospora sp. NPDC057965]|uniref:hypothetical protein n=1 Tax=Kitasatospora sp. NPDC057965 TaxID=3346291 RepID=UPI0036D8592E